MVREGPEQRKVAVDGLLDMLLLPAFGTFQEGGKAPSMVDLLGSRFDLG